jgi:hypothetical protein
VDDVRFYLWIAGLPKDVRKEVAKKIIGILKVLCNSVRRHFVDKDFDRSQWRISWTLSELNLLSRELLWDGLETVARFIRHAANYLVTFARSL